jgi:hypothetical protein
VTFGEALDVSTKDTNSGKRQTNVSKNEGGNEKDGEADETCCLFFISQSLASSRSSVGQALDLFKRRTLFPHPPLRGRLCLFSFKNKAFLFLTPFYVVRGVVKDGRGI